MDVSQNAAANPAPETAAKAVGGRHFWTIGRKITVGFILAIVAGYAATVGLQVTSQRHDELAIAEQQASVKTGMLANAMRVGVYGRDGSSTEDEYKPIAEAPGSTLAGVRVYASDNTPIIGYDNPHLPKYDFTNIDAAIKGFTEFTVTYQASVDEPLPLFRRARTEGGAVQSKEAA